MAIKGSGSPMEAVDEYFDMLIKSRFNEIKNKHPSNNTLGDYVHKLKSERCDDSNLPVLSITKKEGVVLQSDKFKKRVASADLSSYKKAPRGTIIQGIHIDERNFGVQDVVDCGLVSPAYKLWTVDTSAGNPHVIAYALRTDEVGAYIESKFTGSIRRRENISDDDLLQSPLNLPPLEQQEQFLAFMSITNKLRVGYKTLLSLYNQLIKSRFIEMFGNPIVDDKQWCRLPLSMLTTKIGSGSTPSGGKESYIGTDISLVRSMNVHDSSFHYEDLAFITKEQADKLSNVTLEKGDVLLNITGASVARCCVLPSDVLPGRVNQHVCIIRPHNQLNSCFLNHLLISDPVKNYLLHTSKANGATREAITKRMIESFETIVPPIDKQNEFADFVQQVDKSKFEVVQSLLRLKSKYMHTENPSERTDCDL